MSRVVSSGTTAEPYGGWLSANRWASLSLSFSFPADGSFYSYQPTNAVTALGPVQRDAVRAALEEIAGFTRLSFFEQSETPASQATLRYASELGLDGGYAYLPDPGERAGDAFFGSGTSRPVKGNEAYLYFAHEIGHTLGLDHGHEDPSFAGSDLNSQEYTIMTYADYVGDPDLDSYDSGPVDWAQSYMQLDIAALQFLYGANYARTGQAWSGDTVYRFDPDTGEMSLNGEGQGAPAGNRVFRTIWDGHGVDSFDFSNYATDLSVDLRPGHWSVLSAAQLADLDRFSSDPSRLAEGNVATARLFDGDRRALIENAVGGAGDDLLRGNSGDNELRGGGGSDRLLALSGADRLHGGGGRDTLSGRQGADRLKGGDGGDNLKGGDGRDHLHGGQGLDRLRGGDKGDVLIGGPGADRLVGGAGQDRFVYRSEADAARGGRTEKIRDFDHGRDLLDMRALVPGKFDLVLDGGLTGTGPSIATRDIDGDVRVRIDLDGDGKADMELMLIGPVELEHGDFLL